MISSIKKTLVGDSLLNICDAYLLPSSNGSYSMDVLRKSVGIEVVVRIRPAVVVESRN